MLVASEHGFAYGPWHHNEQYQNLRQSAQVMGGAFKPYLQLMRMKNVILASITVPLGAHFAVGDQWLTQQSLEVVSQVLAVIFFIGAGNTMNDIKDVKIDREAHPERPLAAQLISIDNAR